MIKTRLFPLLLALALGGCYQSADPLFDLAEGRQPVPEGDYAEQPGGLAKYTIVKDDAHKGYAVEDSDGTFGMTLVPGKRPGTYYYQAVTSEGKLYYGLVVSRGGQFGFIEPKCDRSDFQGPALAAGAKYDDSGDNPVCLFADRASLEKALDGITVEPTMLYRVGQSVK